MSAIREKVAARNIRDSVAGNDQEGSSGSKESVFIASTGTPQGTVEEGKDEREYEGKYVPPVLSTKTTPQAAGTTPQAAGTTPQAAGDARYAGLLVPKSYQLQPPLPARPPKAAPNQVTLWEAPGAGSLSKLIVDTTSGSRMASGPDRDTLYALTTLARHAVERYPHPADDVALVRAKFEKHPEGGEVIAGGIVVATSAAVHAIIGRDNDWDGRQLTTDGIERLAGTRITPEGTEGKTPLLGYVLPIQRSSLVNRSLKKEHNSKAAIQKPANQVKDPLWFAFEPSSYLWDNILDSEAGWWVSAGAYRRLNEGRGLWLWLKGQTQAEVIRAGARIEIHLRLLHDKLGLHSRDAAVARRSLQRAAADIYEKVPGFLRGLPVFGIGGRGFAGKVRFTLDPDSEHIASIRGKNLRLEERRRAIDAGEIEVRGDDIVRLMLRVKGIGWDDIAPMVQLRHAKLLIEEKPDITLAEIEPHMRWHEQDDYWCDSWDLATIRRRWTAVLSIKAAA